MAYNWGSYKNLKSKVISAFLLWNFVEIKYVKYDKKMIRGIFFKFDWSLIRIGLHVFFYVFLFKSGCINDEKFLIIYKRTYI